MAKRRGAAAPREPSFEQALERLEEIVRRLEESDLPLDDSLAVFEEGVRLSRLLHHKLEEAERKVEILLKNEAGAKVPVPFGGAAAAEAREDEAAGEAGGEEGDAGEGEDEGSTGAGQRRLF